jgi:tetratricopeptide (TPR) repeat protein
MFFSHAGRVGSLAAILFVCAGVPPASAAAAVRVAATMDSATAVALAQDAARARETYARAVDFEAHGRHAEALPLLWDAAQLAPDDAEIQNRLGEALERIGALDAAVDAYRRAVARDPASRKAANNLILVLAKGGRVSEALELARAAVAAAPADADRLFTLGLAQAEYDLDAAIDTFRRVLVLAPHHGLARYNLALTLKRADRPADAAAELLRLVQSDPRPEAQYTLGVIYWQQGDLDRAADLLRAAIAANPQYADAHATLGAVLKAKGDLGAAAASLRRAIALTPESAGPHYVLAQVLRLMGDEHGARTQVAESERLRQQREHDQEASVLTFLGIQRFEAGEPAAAVDYFRQATAVSERYAPAHYQMGRALQRLGRTADARAAFRRAQQLNPALLPPSDLP